MKRTLVLFVCSLTAAIFFTGNVRAQSGSALVFDGVNDFANIPLFATNAPTNEITIEFWQNVSSIKAQATFGTPPDAVTNRIVGHVPWIDGVVYWDFGNLNTAGRLFYTPPNPITNSWQHFAFVASSNGNYMRIYRNGVLEAQKTGMTPFVRGTNDLNLGQINNGFFAGQLDEFRIWNVARSSNEISTNFMRSLTGNEAGLLVYVRANEGSGTSTADAAALGGNTTAFLSNGVAWAASGASVGGLFVTMADALLIDTNGNGKPSAGDTIRYTVTIQNNSTNTLTNVVLNVPATPNNTLVPGSVKVPPKAVNDAPATNSIPGFDLYHGFFNSVLNLSAAAGLLANDTLGAPVGSIASFGGGSFPGTATTTASGSSAVAANVGSLTVNANGSVTFTPIATFNGLATFQYRLTNAQGGSIATATVAVGARPVATNDTHFITGNTMFDSSLAFATSVLANDSGDGRALAGSTAGVNGTVTLNANGSFLFTPNAGFTGPASFTYTITNGFGPSVGTVNLNVTNLLWYIDNSVAVNGDGRSSSPFKNTSDFTAVNDGAAGHPTTNGVIFLRQGASNYTGGVTLRHGQRFIGDGANGSFVSLFGFSLAQGSAKAPGVSVPTFSGVRPQIRVVPFDAVTLASTNTVVGMNINAGNGRALTGAGTGALVISNVAAGANLEAVVNFSGGYVLNVSLDSASATNGSQGMLVISNCTGSFSAPAGTISYLGGVSAVRLVGGSANVNYGGSVNGGGSGILVDIQGRTGGTATLSGSINGSGGAAISVANCTGGTVNFSGNSKTLNTGANTAVSLVNNTGTTINFTGGGLKITNSVTGFTAIGGAAGISVTGSGNIINSGTATALNVVNTTIGASDLTFQTISSSGGSATGIILDTTGSLGGLHVTGLDGVDAGSDPDPGSGGTIANKTGADGAFTTGNGIYLNSAADVRLAGMQLNDFQNSAIRGFLVTGFSLEDSVISGVVGTSTGEIEGAIAFGHVGPAFQNGLVGSSLIDNVNISGSIEHQLEVYNQSGTMNLTITNANIHDNSVAGGSDGIQMEFRGTAQVFTKIDGCSFSNNKSQAIQISSLETANVHATIRRNTVTRGTQGNEGIVLSNGGDSDFTALIGGPTAADGNTISGFGGVAIFVGQVPGQGTPASLLQATIQNNNVTSPPTASNHGIIAFLSSLSGQISQARLLIDTNTVTYQSAAARAILVDAPDATRTPEFHATVRNNLVTASDINAVTMISVAARNGAIGHSDIRGNDVNFTGGASASGVNVREATLGSNVLARGGSASNDAATVLAANNPLSTTAVLPSSPDIPVVENNTILLPATPTLPTLP